ncbi:UDP-N-acetylmuramoyl-L-alanyl-D-glutamate--2,6-diaminopimelate ligase [Aquisalibacillus elongatus]|uniref:UDP-N-acetylmuramoyl-L-alanyl-D-glutamate--2,6-diaminopimelate ligase n=1 Tax=Aquisalibacillus elongatus TaxID=485577 RepID=A0A3N5BF18_9BACI|nr:UDP-N-acetylmuramoyl-L-alanyl-D-glutamate--2,6-diaminopimelate ligase [Aquisalibacillus elongatus]RPF56083.1 UDP-N-acetylmuramoylalanyl-D-glutamate--2,6-diaminopimelate ligase [Aquisalibacillus elongatus]
MFLHELMPVLKVYDTENVPTNQLISTIEMDSRKVEKDSLFVCIKGFQADGHEYVREAEKRGACAIIAEKEITSSLPVIYVPSTQKALAILADYFYGSPSQELTIIGVTGTNGKTTTTYLLDAIFKTNGSQTAIIGTIDMKIGNESYKLTNTTPDSLFLHKHLRLMKRKGVETVIMEVSSHALHLGRVYGIQFDTVVFTNLTQDHLDYHLNMNDYAYAKSLLFSQLGNDYKQNKIAVINLDDNYAEAMSRATPFPVMTYGLSDDCFVKAQHMKLKANQSTFKVLTPFDSFTVSSHLTGRFNVYNILAAISVAIHHKIPKETIIKALGQSKGIPGRVESVDLGQNFNVIVDYAHTPDSLENVLSTLSDLKQNRIITVVGCGGDRDRGKRPKMADVAVQYSDFTIFTSDNPRYEDPKDILKDMTGHLSLDQYTVLINRTEAIEKAIVCAAKDDIVLIAGKGHETYQEVRGKRHRFDDREIARTYIEKRMKESS